MPKCVCRGTEDGKDTERWLKWKEKWGWEDFRNDSDGVGKKKPPKKKLLNKVETSLKQSQFKVF